MKILSTAPKKDARIDVASMVTSVTRVSPIISAAADEPVRCGFRIAFSRARIPGAPASRSPGTPSTAASGRISCDGEERDAEEDEHGADAHEDEDRPRSARAPHPVGEREEAEDGQRRRADAAVPGEAARRQLRAFANGCDRRHARRAAAPGAGWRASSRASRPARQTTIVRGLEEEARCSAA